MRLPRISIERPVLASVFSLALIVLGVSGYQRLPVRELPDVEFPIVSVTTVLPGASPEVMETEVTELLEENLNGIEGVDFLQSVSNEQVSTITLQFELGRDIDAAAQDVRDRVGRVRNQLPEDVEEPRVRKIDADARAIMWVALYSEVRDRSELIEIADDIVKPRFEGVPGVGQIYVGGSNRPAMRIELDRALLAARELALDEVIDALRRENVEIPSGRVEGSLREFVVRTAGDLVTTEEFENLIVAYRDGRPVRMADIGSVRIGHENERTLARFRGIPTTGLGIVKQSRANTLEVAAGIHREVTQLRDELPEGFELRIAFDQSVFIQQSVAEVQQSLVLAAILVAMVIFVFLQSIRSTAIPAIVMPVSVIGTFGAMHFLGFTINNLTLMALTLVIGVVVDDAIIVLENVYRHMQEGKPRMEAALAASSEIAFAVVATTATLVAVFVPIAFLSGVVGRFFYEFGITVTVAVCVSSFVALTLTPMLCSRFLTTGDPTQKRGIAAAVARRFEATMDAASSVYSRLLARLLGQRLLMTVVLLLSVGISAWLFTEVGKEFVPEDDRGYLIASIRSPEGSTLTYQDRYQRQVERMLDETPEILSYFSIVAMGSGGPGKVNSGIMFVRMVDSSERSQSTAEVVAHLRRRSVEIVGADAFFFTTNPMRQSNRSKPLQFVVQHPDFEELGTAAAALASEAAAIPGLTDVDTDLELNKPQLSVSIDRHRAAELGISALDIADPLRILLGGSAVTKYRRGNDRYDVILQLQAKDRFSPDDLARINIRTGRGDLVPMSNVVQVRESVGPSAVNHYGRRRSVVIDANLDGTDLGKAIEALSELAAERLPEGFTTTLSGESREFRRGSEGLLGTFLLAIIAIYLVLAAQFESFVHPFTIMLALPLATVGAFAGLYAFGMSLNVYSFIGVIMLMGLVTKNSILFVDYVNLLRSRGEALRDAVVEAGRVRLRPILMTAVSTVFGILPIALGLGAGSEGRRPLGVAVVCGMAFSTLLTLLVVPVIYEGFGSFAERRRARRDA